MRQGIHHGVRHGAARARPVLRRLAPRLFLRLCEPSAGELGEAGEELAARWLARRGWRVLARRQATGLAEIDLVALEGADLVCVEVKTGRSPAAGPRGWRPGERLGARRLARQRRAARRLRGAWAGSSAGGATRARVDLVEVLVRPDGVEIVHHRGLVRPL